MSVFALPDLGEGLTEVEIVEWKVAVGDTVAIDQVVVEVETAKAMVEVPSPYAGVVEVLHGVPGTTMTVGSPLITVAGAAVAHERHRAEEQAGSGNVLIGYGTSGAGPRRRRARPTPPDSALVPVRSATPAPGVPVLSPIVRKLARDNRVDTRTLSGSGAGGVVTRRDVEAAISASAQMTAVALPDDDERIPLTGLRRAVADKLTTSRREIPDATTWVDVDATGLVHARRMINASTSAGAEPISLLALLARLTLAALTRFPELNSSVDTARQEIVRHARVNLSFAAQSPRGLLVPVVHGADRMSLRDLAAAVRDLTTAARDGSLTPAQLTGGTFTLNNYGPCGVDGSTPIINHPEAAMLGIGRIIERPWVVDGQLAVRQVTQLSFTFDHRVADGGSAGGFLRFAADCLEKPGTLLAEL